MSPSAISEVTESYRRCVAFPSFFDRFYVRLFARRPDVEAMFEGVNRDAQRTMVRKALAMLLLLAAGSENSTDTLDRVRASHGPEGLGVSEPQYRAWTDCLLETVAETDPHFNAALEAGWRQVIESGVRYLRR